MKAFFLWLFDRDGFRNWRTTLTGLIAATGNIVYAWLQGTLDTRTFIYSFVIALLTYLMKDASQTGTKAKPR